MKRLSWWITTALVAWLAPAFASAQLAGVAADALTPEGMERVEVNLPEEAHHGVHLYYAATGQSRPTLRIEVYVAVDARDAAEVAERFVETTAGELPSLVGVADGARGDAGLVIFRHQNLFVAVRELSHGAHDCVALSRAIDLRLAGAARGSSRSALRLSAPELSEGLNAIQLPADALAAHVTASGSAYARRTRSGWVVERRGEGPWSVAIIATDGQLRRTRVERSAP